MKEGKKRKKEREKEKWYIYNIYIYICVYSQAFVGSIAVSVLLVASGQAAG